MISIHALREEGDLYIPYYNAAGEISIHALREEGDGLLIAPTRCLCNFYPRPPRGGRHGKEDLVAIIVQFLSTPSARRATHTSLTGNGHEPISIHALREEGDSMGRLQI